MALVLSLEVLGADIDTKPPQVNIHSRAGLDSAITAAAGFVGWFYGMFETFPEGFERANGPGCDGDNCRIRAIKQRILPDDDDEAFLCECRMSARRIIESKLEVLSEISGVLLEKGRLDAQEVRDLGTRFELPPIQTQASNL